MAFKQGLCQRCPFVGTSFGAAAYFFYSERRSIFSNLAPSPRFGAPLLAFSVALYTVFALGGLSSGNPIPASSNYRLTLLIFAVVLAWSAGFVLCYGPRTLKAGRFPILLLLLLVPVPFNWMDSIVTTLQHGSAEVTFAFFRLLDVPVFRDGVRFELPHIGIEIAKECSSIHSGCALFITGILLSHIFLKSLWPKIVLVVLTVPIAMFTNAVRIVTLWTLATKVDIRFLTGSLHHQGGILFSLISLAILAGILFLFRKLERR